MSDRSSLKRPGRRRCTRSWNPTLAQRVRKRGALDTVKSISLWKRRLGWWWTGRAVVDQFGIQDIQVSAAAYMAGRDKGDSTVGIVDGVVGNHIVGLNSIVSLKHSLRQVGQGRSIENGVAIHHAVGRALHVDSVQRVDIANQIVADAGTVDHIQKDATLQRG